MFILICIKYKYNNINEILQDKKNLILVSSQVLFPFLFPHHGGELFYVVDWPAD